MYRFLAAISLADSLIPRLLTPRLITRSLVPSMGSPRHFPLPVELQDLSYQVAFSHSPPMSNPRVKLLHLASLAASLLLAFS